MNRKILRDAWDSDLDRLERQVISDIEETKKFNTKDSQMKVVRLKGLLQEIRISKKERGLI